MQSVPRHDIRARLQEGEEGGLNFLFLGLGTRVGFFIDSVFLLQATQVSLKEDEIHSLVNKAREIFMAQPVLLELEAPLKVVGDVHGQ
jgi:hypothetical protein